jgi:hypothetical protein
MKLALLIIGGLCEIIFVLGLMSIHFFNQNLLNQAKGLEASPDWKSFLWFAVGTVCLIFGFCL